MGAVLVGRGGENPLVLNAQAQPPPVERREPVDAAGGEGHPVVGANGAGQPVLPGQPLEDRAHAVASRREQAVAGQKISGVLVGNRRRVAVESRPLRAADPGSAQPVPLFAVPASGRFMIATVAPDEPCSDGLVLVSRLSRKPLIASARQTAESLTTSGLCPARFYRPA